MPRGKTFFRAKKAFLCVETSVQSEPILGWWLLAVVIQLLVGSKFFPIISIPKAPLEKGWQRPGSSQLHPVHRFSVRFLSSTGRSKALPWQLHGDLLGISSCYGSLTAEKDAVQSVCMSSLYAHSLAIRIINGCWLLANEGQLNCSGLDQFLVSELHLLIMGCCFCCWKWRLGFSLTSSTTHLAILDGCSKKEKRKKNLFNQIEKGLGF